MVPTFSHCFYPPMTLVLAHYKYGPQTCHLQFRSISHLQIIVEFYPLRLRWLSGYGPAIKLARVNRTSLGTNRNLYSMVTLIRIGRRQWFDQRFRPTTCCVVTQTVPVFVTFLLQMELGVRFLCQGVHSCLSPKRDDPVPVINGVKNLCGATPCWMDIAGIVADGTWIGGM